jgi:hypothetical protein
MAIARMAVPQIFPALSPSLRAGKGMRGAENYCNVACVSLTAQYAAVVPHWVVDVACVPK